MKRIVWLTTMVFCAVFILSATNPDFAHPKTTLKSAIMNYNEAMHSSGSKGTMLVKSLLEISGATAAIDIDSIKTVIPRVDKAINADCTAATRSLLLLVKAELLNDIYVNKRWVYDRVNTPDSPVPSDISEWNGRQFKNQISSLAAKAFDLASEAPVDRLANYSSVVKADKLALRYFNTLSDFVAYKSIELLSNSDNVEKAKTVLDKVLGLCRPLTASWFYWSVRKTDEISVAVEEVADDDDNADKKKETPLERLYLDNADIEDAGYVLKNIAERYWNPQDTPEWLIPAMKKFVTTYPEFAFTPDIANRLADLTKPMVKVTTKSIVAPGQSFEVAVNYGYTSQCGFNIYRISRKAYQNRSKETLQLVKKINIVTDKDIASADTTVNVTLPKAGYYKIVPTLNIPTDNDGALFMLSMPFIATYLNGTEREAFTIVDYMTGAPLSNVAVNQQSKYKTTKLGRSDSNGILSFDPGTPKDHSNNNWVKINYMFNYQGETYNLFKTQLYNSSSYTQSRVKANIITDRKIYHHGDTINWMAIAIVDNGEGNHNVLTGCKIQVELRDANYQSVAKTELVTDDFGRIKGIFIAPTNGLSGKFRIEASLIGNDGKIENNHIGYTTITVSDFKMPTFQVDSLSVERDMPNKGEVTIKGQAMTFTGMSVVGAKVEAEIWEASRWRWFTPNRQLGIVTAMTNENGNFSLVVPDSITAKTKANNFVAKITVTSNDGEANKASKSFTTGKPYTIMMDASKAYINTDSLYQIPVEVYNADGKNVDIELRWWLYRAGESKAFDKAVISGTLHSVGKPTIDLSSVASGIYSIGLEPVDPTLANRELTDIKLNLYSITKGTMPDVALFTPQTSYVTDNNGDAEIIIGNPKECYIYQSFAYGDKLGTIKVEKMQSGFHKLKLHLPEGVAQGRLYAYTTIDGVTTSKAIHVYRIENKRLTLTGSSMRDRLQPGQGELWTLKLTDGDGKAMSGAMVATMFNGALNQLETYNMPSGFNISYKSTSISQRLEMRCARILYPNVSFGRLNFQKTVNLNMPDFKPSLIYANLMSRGRIYVRGLKAKSDNIEEAEAAVEEVATVKYASTKQNYAFIVTEDAEVEAKGIDEEVAGDGENQLESQPQEFEYRDAEVLQAFWMPEITINEQGEAILSFTAPNANAQWSFNAFAWTKDLRTANMVRQIIATKPVMVTPNLPRFLRTGDNAKVLATVYNNSNSDDTVTTIIETFDITNGNTLTTTTSTDLIEAGHSVIVSIDVAAPDNRSAIGYRVRSTLGEFTDGEQSWIAIEPATSDVIESEIFYLNPGEADYSTTLPKGKDMTTTLDYTENPTWNIIKELPGLNTIDPITAPMASRLLFGAATAQGLLKSYPTLAKVLKMWADNPDSKALTSRLSQNDNLKAAVLNETPWVQAAASDSHRMARLSLLFDTKTVNANIDRSINTLKKLQQQNGGWAWGEWSDKASEWSTRIILCELGQLKAIGYLPEDKGLDKMIKSALNYLSSQIKATDKTDIGLTYIASLFPDYGLGLEAKRVVNATIQDIIGNWKKHSTAVKATDVLILNSLGYPAVSKKILGSVKEFAVESASQGTSFPSVNSVDDYANLLYAFAKVDPNAAVIDGMRQWLIVRQQATSALGSWNPTALIAAYMATGTNWNNNITNKTTISVGGMTLEPDSVEAATGHFVTALDASSAGKSLTIVRSTPTTPAYGGIISRFVRHSTDIKAKSCADLSIEKRVTALRNGRWQYVSEVRLGEQVRVLLTIKTKRDLDYVTIIDQRPASFEPVDQLPGWVWSAGAGFYRENRDSSTNLFINHLTRGTYQITIDFTASIAGTFTSGIATVQSQLTPEITAHSAGSTLVCE